MINSSRRAPAYECYKELLIRAISNTIYQDPPLRTWGDNGFDWEERMDGGDWPSLAQSMAGTLRPTNLADLVTRVLEEGAEAGHLARRILHPCAGPFESPRRPNAKCFCTKGDTFYLYPELAVSLEQVKANCATMECSRILFRHCPADSLHWFGSTVTCMNQPWIVS